MANRLYVGNLDFRTSSDDLIQLFAGAGQVVSASVITDRETGRSKGFAFIEMSSDAEAVKAIGLYNGHVLNERSLTVSEARAREERSSRPSFGRDSNAADRPKFREVKHRSRGGANRRRF